MKDSKILIGVFVLVAILCLVYNGKQNSKPTVTTHKVEGFASRQPKLEDFIDEAKLKQADPTEYAKLEKLLKDFRQDLKGDLPSLDKFALRSEIPNESCVVSKSVDKDNYIKKSELDEIKKCPVPGDYDPTQYILKSSVPAKSCPPQQEIDTTKWVLKSSLPPPQKCSPCICPKVSVSAGLCKKCPPPPKCPPPKPCPQMKCPEVKPCPPPAPCPACPEQKPCPPKICPPCPPQKECPPKICPPCPVNNKIVERVYLDANGNELKRVQVEEGDDGKDVILACPTDAKGNKQGVNVLDNVANKMIDDKATDASNNSVNGGDDNNSSFGSWFQKFSNSSTNHNGLPTPTAYSKPVSPTKSGSDTVDTGSLIKNNSKNNNNMPGQFKVTNAKMETPRPSYAPTKDAMTRDDQKCSNMSFNQSFKQYRPF